MWELAVASVRNRLCVRAFFTQWVSLGFINIVNECPLRRGVVEADGALGVEERGVREENAVDVEEEEFWHGAVQGEE